MKSEYVDKFVFETDDTSEIDFFRCLTCGRLVTQPEMRTCLASGGTIGLCGHFKVSPVNPAWWEFIVYPRVWYFAYLRITRQM